MVRWLPRLATAIAAMTSSPGHAQDDFTNALALGVVLYEQTKDKCYYEPVVGQTLTKVDNQIGELMGPQWQNTKRGLEGAGGDLVANVFGLPASSADAPPDECAWKGHMIGRALAISVVFVGTEPALEQAAHRLTEIGGRGLTDPPRAGELVAKPSEPTAVEIMADYNNRILDGAIERTRTGGDLLLEVETSGGHLSFRGDVKSHDNDDNVSMRIAASGEVAVAWDVFIECSSASYSSEAIQGTDEQLGRASTFLPEAVVAAARRECRNLDLADTPAAEPSEAITGEQPSTSTKDCRIQVKGRADVTGACLVETSAGSIMIRMLPQSSGDGLFFVLQPADGFAEAYWNGEERESRAHEPLGLLRRDEECWRSSLADICMADY